MILLVVSPDLVECDYIFAVGDQASQFDIFSPSFWLSDKDECSEEGKCESGQYCANTPGSFTCESEQRCLLYKTSLLPTK